MKVDVNKLTPAELKYYKHFLACEKQGISRKEYCSNNNLKPSTFSHYVGQLKRKSGEYAPRKYDVGSFKKVSIKDASKLCKLTVGSELNIEFKLDQKKISRLLEVLFEKY